VRLRGVEEAFRRDNSDEEDLARVAGAPANSEPDGPVDSRHLPINRPLPDVFLRRLKLPGKRAEVRNRRLVEKPRVDFNPGLFVIDR
jgi:hypothetical protein